MRDWATTIDLTGLEGADQPPAFTSYQEDSDDALRRIADRLSRNRPFIHPNLKGSIMQVTHDATRRR
jgi:hypothetical protein